MTVLTLPDGDEKAVVPPLVLRGPCSDLRKAMVDPLRGAWTWCHVWMDADDLVLHAEFDWMREPLFDQDKRPPSDAACAAELERYPRAAEHVPGWMAVGAARHRRVPAAVDVDVLALLGRLFPDTPDIDGNGLWVWAHVDAGDGQVQRPA